jgi:putative oxidoreductase
MVLTALGLVVAGLGAGEWSLDHAIGIFDPPGGRGFVIAAAAGGGAAAALLAACWRPPRKPAGT